MSDFFAHVEGPQTLEELEELTGCRNPAHFPPPWRLPLYWVWPKGARSASTSVYERRHRCGGCGKEFRYHVPVRSG